MHKENRNTGVKQVCKGGPQHLHGRNGETEPEKGLSSFLQFPLYLVACCWTVNDSVQLGESRLRPGTLPLWGSSRGSLQGIRGDPVYQPSSRVQKESRHAMRLSPVMYLKCTVSKMLFHKDFALIIDAEDVFSHVDIKMTQLSICFTLHLKCCLVSSCLISLKVPLFCAMVK